MIKEAAILKDGVIYTGKRHNEIIEANKSILGHFGSDEVQGFVTDCGDFVNRQVAAEIAVYRGQVAKYVQTLYSEDLY